MKQPSLVLVAVVTVIVNLVMVGKPCGSRNMTATTGPGECWSGSVLAARWHAWRPGAACNPLTQPGKQPSPTTPHDASPPRAPPPPPWHPAKGETCITDEARPLSASPLQKQK